MTTLKRYNGTTWETVGAPSGTSVPSPDNVPASPNASDYEFNATTSSLPSGWSWVNQGSATYREEFGGGVIFLPGGGTENHRMIVEAMPASTWTLTAKMVGSLNQANYMHYAIYLRQSSDGKLAGIGNHSDAAVRLTTWTSHTGGGSVVASFSGSSHYQPLTYFKIRRNSSSSWDFYASADGIGWSTLATAYNLSAFMTPDQIGFGGNAQGSVSNIELVCQWFRIT